MSADPSDLPTHEPPLLDEAIVAGAVAAHAADAHGHGGPAHTHCENCGAELQGAFCHRCGQHDFEFHRSFGHVFLEALENFFHFDAKFFRNIITLLFRPGRLSADFNAGKRASQMPPFRLYLFVSVLFFLVAFLGSGPPDEIDGTTLRPVSAEKQAEAREALADALDEAARQAGGPADRARLAELAAQARDPKGAPLRLTEELPNTLPKPLAKKIRRLAAAQSANRNLRFKGAGDRAYWEEIAREVQDNSHRAGKPRTATEREFNDWMKRALEHQHDIQEAFSHALPKMLLACLPFFALFTRVLFRRSGYVYLQHFVVALHYHTFVYLWWVVSRGWVKAVDLGSPGLATFLEFGVWAWILLYPLLMLRRLFGQSWKRTVFKTGLLACAYGFTLMFGFMLTAAIVFLMV